MEMGENSENADKTMKESFSCGIMRIKQRVRSNLQRALMIKRNAKALSHSLDGQACGLAFKVPVETYTAYQTTLDSSFGPTSDDSNFSPGLCSQSLALAWYKAMNTVSISDVNQQKGALLDFLHSCPSLSLT